MFEEIDIGIKVSIHDTRSLRTHTIRANENRIRRVSTSFESWSSNLRNERNTKYGCSPITFTDRFAQTDNRGSLPEFLGNDGIRFILEHWIWFTGFQFQTLLDYVLILRRTLIPTFHLHKCINRSISIYKSISNRRWKNCNTWIEIHRI